DGLPRGLPLTLSDTLPATRASERQQDFLGAINARARSPFVFQRIERDQNRVRPAPAEFQVAPTLPECVERTMVHTRIDSPSARQRYRMAVLPADQNTRSNALRRSA